MPGIELTDIDRHFARAMSRMSGNTHPALALAAALASRATGQGDVCVRLADFATQEIGENGERAPPLDEWLHVLRESAVVGAPGEFRPLVLDASGRLYLYRYWDYERRLADGLLARACDACDVDEALLRQGLQRYFSAPHESEQKLAAATAVLRRLCVISGGPGTGKTTTVVKILALLAQQARGRRLAIAIAAPTGKAAARVHEAMRSALKRLDLADAALESLPDEAHTLHRLLGARPDSVHYRRNRDNPLPLDALVVDEASMADLALAAKLVEALPPRTRLILLGDKDQLASVEAGSVLGDICGAGVERSAAFTKRLSRVTGLQLSSARRANGGSPMGDSVALLERSYRFGPQSGIGRLARAVNAGDAAHALALLADASHGDIALGAVGTSDLRGRLAREVTCAWRGYFEAVHANAPPQTLFECLNAFRVLCAHRRGARGAMGLNATIEDVLDEHGLIDARETWYTGRPVMITRNDYNVRLFNGDVGIAVREGASVRVVFAAEGGFRTLAPARLPEHETVYAMTVHKSQGSEFDRVLMVLPDDMSAIATRELVYTAITRARAHVEIWADAALFTAAIERPLARQSGLRERLWRA